MDAYDISASAMTAQRLRLDMIASNLANVNTTRKNDGSIGAYRRRNVVFAPIMQNKMENFAERLPLKSSSSSMDGSHQIVFNNGVPTLKATITNDAPVEAQGVKVVRIEEDFKTPLKMVYDPSHPDADEKGYVNLPNINPVTEMVDMIAATRAYEANVSSIQAAKSIGRASLEI